MYDFVIWPEYFDVRKDYIGVSNKKPDGGRTCLWREGILRVYLLTASCHSASTGRLIREARGEKPGIRVRALFSDIQMWNRLKTAKKYREPLSMIRDITCWWR
jgi:hypothetical protein